MATQTTTPEMEAGIESARSALAAALSGKPAPAAASTPPVEPTPAPAPPPEPAPATAPVTPAPAAPAISGLPAGLAPTTPSPAPSQAAPPLVEAKPATPTFTDPAAARFLEMKGGNLEKALADAMAYNNRLSQMRDAHPEWFAPGAPGDPRQASTVPPSDTPFTETPPPPGAAPPAAEPPVGQVPPLDWEQIAQVVDHQVLVDNVCKPLIETWTRNDEVIRAAEAKIQEGEHRLSYLQALLSDPKIQLPELDKETFEDERRTLSFDIGIARNDRIVRQMENRDLDNRFRARRAQIVDGVSSGYAAQAREQATQAEIKQIEDAEEQRVLAVWPGALARVVAANQIPVDMTGDFEGYAKQVAQASMNDPRFSLDDVEGFLGHVAKNYVERLDRYHRARAAQYGANAVARAASPAPTPPAGSPAPPPATPTNVSPEQAMEDAQRYLRERLRG